MTPAAGAQPSPPVPAGAGRLDGLRGALDAPRLQAPGAGRGDSLCSPGSPAPRTGWPAGLLVRRGQLAAGGRDDLGHAGGWLGEPGQAHLPATYVHGHGTRPSRVPSENRGEAGHAGRGLQGRITGAGPTGHVVEEGDVGQARGSRRGCREQVPVRPLSMSAGSSRSCPGDVGHGQPPGRPACSCPSRTRLAWRAGRVQDPRRTRDPPVRRGPVRSDAAGRRGCRSGPIPRWRRRRFRPSARTRRQPSAGRGWPGRGGALR